MYQLPRPTVQRGTLSPGRQGTAETLSIMRTLAREGADMPEVRAAAERIVAHTSNNVVEQLAALFRWVCDTVRFTPDPRGVETIRSPRRALVDRVGDCDDKSTLLAGLVLALRLPVRLWFRVIGTRPGSSQFSHVYVVADYRGQRMALDATHGGTPFGWEFPRPIVEGDFPV